MRSRPPLSVSFCCAAALALSACAAPEGPGRRVAALPEGVPPGVGGAAEPCKLIVLEREGTAEVVQKKSEDDAGAFPYLGDQSGLLPIMQVEEDGRQECAAAFGLGGGGAGAPGAAAGAAIPSIAIGVSIAALLGAALATQVLAGEETSTPDTN